MTLLQHHVLALSLTALTTFGLGLLVFFAEPARRLNQIFGLYSLTIGGWAFAEIFVIVGSDQHTVNLWAYAISWPVVIFITPTFLHSVFLSIGKDSRAAKLILRVSYALSFVFLALHFLLPGFLTKPPMLSAGYEHFRQDLSTLGSAIPLTFLVLVNLALWHLWHARSQATGQRRTQLTYLFWASVAAYAGGSPDWCLAYRIHLPFLNPFGLYGVPCYSIATTYAVLHHRLFNVNVVIRRSLVYSLLVTALTVGYFGLVYGVERFFQTTLGYRSVWLSLAAFALMALLFQPLKIAIQRLVDWFFFRAPHEELVKRMERLDEEVRHADKLKAISTLAAGMAHEIKNPLTSIKTFTESLETHYEDPSFRAKFQKIVSGEVERINLIVQQLLDFAKPASPHLESVPVRRLLDETLDFMSSECLKRRVEVYRRYGTDDTIQADPQQLRQVFLNLFLNSLESMNGSGGQLSVATVRDGSRLAVTINDTGHGIPKEQLQHIFDPFFTTKQGGTGLGLSVVHSIITEHRGTIAFESQPNHGTTCTLTFPLSR